MARAADAVEVWISDGIARMMNVFNRAPGEDGSATTENEQAKTSESDDH